MIIDRENYEKCFLDTCHVVFLHRTASLRTDHPGVIAARTGTDRLYSQSLFEWCLHLEVSTHIYYKVSPSTNAQRHQVNIFLAIPMTPKASSEALLSCKSQFVIEEMIFLLSISIAIINSVWNPDKSLEENVKSLVHALYGGVPQDVKAFASKSESTGLKLLDILVDVSFFLKASSIMVFKNHHRSLLVTTPASLTSTGRK